MQFKSSFFLSLAIAPPVAAFHMPVPTAFGTARSIDTSLNAKKIILCFDGTGNDAEDFVPDKDTDKSFTNVLKLHLLAGGSIDNKSNHFGPEQISIYEPGVGTRGNKLTNLLRIMGGDLSHQIDPLMEKLEKVYEAGDQLYMIGFSRGSAAARQVASDLNKKGITTKDGEHVPAPPIEFLGCFDTVSMQIKDNWHEILKTKKNKKFPLSDVVGEEGFIAPNVNLAAHNLALDDNRMWAGGPCFPPLLMGAEDKVHEAWFPGEHGDSGGNFYSDGIPDGSCKAMQDWMKHAGVDFITADQIKPESLVIPDREDLKVEVANLEIVPNPADRIHLNEFQIETPSYRTLYVVKDDEEVEGATVNIHESVLYHMEAMKEKGEKYNVNGNLKDAKFRVVSTLGKVLEDETERLAKLLESEYAELLISPKSKIKL